MTDNNSFFRIVWRINGLIIMLLAVCGLALTIFALKGIFTNVTRERTVTSIVNLDESKEIKEQLEFGYVYHVDNSPIISVALNSDQKYTQAYFSKVSKSARNYLFVNTDTDEQSWLFQHNSFLIKHRETLVYKRNEQKNREPVGYLFQIIKTDTNSDQRITGKDYINVSLSGLMGNRYKEIVSEVDKVIGHKISEAGILNLFYQKQNQVFLVRVSLLDFSVIETQNIKVPISNN